ncbi:MAG: endonuclease/exonuclease/phosphatase family protein [Planctomycetota bacterium]
MITPAQPIARSRRVNTSWAFSSVQPLLAVLAFAAAACTLGGCGLFGGSDAKPADARVPERAAPLIEPSLEVPPMTIAIDGDISDWPLDHAVLADDQYLYVRFKLDRTAALQAYDESLMLQIDADANASTGRRDGPLGIDLAVTFSPTGADGSRRGGTRVEAYSDSQRSAEVSPSLLDISFAPTHASVWFEARIARNPAAAGVLPTEGLLGSGAVAGRVVLFDAAGRPVAAADRFQLNLVPAAEEIRRDSLVAPAKPLDAVRVVSYNVLNAAPDTTPEPFTRMLRVLEPDVVLIQEWYDQTPGSLADWFNRNLPIAGRWSAVTSQGRGVAVVSRFDTRPLGPDALTIRPENEDRTVRIASAMIESPIGPIAASSLHLKCCGELGGREDTIRAAEAEGIVRQLRESLAGIGPHARIIGGDLNLVGGTEPLEILQRRTDIDGSDLAVAEPFVLGDPAVYTWTQSTSRFLPGRLDYVLYSDAAVEVARSFVFDPERLDASALRAMNLELLDARSSDHRPVVIDFRPVR